MVVSLSLNPSGAPPQLLHTTMSSPGLPAENADTGSRTQKLTKAAQEFEGILLSSWLEEMQKSSLDPSDAGQEAGSETLRSLGTQAVAQAWAQRGGLGIARMIVRHFSTSCRDRACPILDGGQHGGQGRVRRLTDPPTER
jgi:Rod binding domain-containing protein